MKLIYIFTQIWLLSWFQVRKAGIEAFSKVNIKLAELYAKSETTIFVTKTVQTTVLLPFDGNIKTSRLEKVLVDALAEPRLYGQAQGLELENIYENASETYALNYSQMLKYATNRGKRDAVDDLLKRSKSYQEYMEAILWSKRIHSPMSGLSSKGSLALHQKIKIPVL